MPDIVSVFCICRVRCYTPLGVIATNYSMNCPALLIFELLLNAFQNIACIPDMRVSTSSRTIYWNQSIHSTKYFTTLQHSLNEVHYLFFWTSLSWTALTFTLFLIWNYVTDWCIIKNEFEGLNWSIFRLFHLAYSSHLILSNLFPNVKKIRWRHER